MFDDVKNELTSSKLGTKQYWDDFYTKELVNFKENEDEGEIWFGHNRMMKVVNWLLSNKCISKSAVVLDIGSGNGVFLLELAEAGFQNLYGIDYSANAVELAQNIASSQDKDVKYKQADILVRDTVNFDNRKTFDVCHDKGTYDAVSLREDAKISRQQYIDTLHSILEEKSSYFVITSCNWTLEELKLHFRDCFNFITHIPAPSFKFGGKSGSTVSTAVFTKKIKHNYAS